MADPTAIANEFVKFYYQTFDSGRANLTALYVIQAARRAHSMLTFEGSQFQGMENIVKKLVELPFQKVQHKYNTCDVQPSNMQGNGILIFVTGQLLVDEESTPLFFSQVFQLMQEGGNWYVFNDVFRLNLA